MKCSKMRNLWRVVLLLLAVSLLLTGCIQKPEGGTKPKDEKGPKPSLPVQQTEPATEDITEPATEVVTEPVTEAPQEYDPSLTGLRQAMIGTSQLFAVAYFGYHETQDMQMPVEPYEVMGKRAPWLFEDLPFLRQIPQDRIVGESGELYCIVPLDEDATVAVSRGIWDDMNGQTVYDDLVYSSDRGEPILLFCNGSGWEPDTEVYISGSSGDVYWNPALDDNKCCAELLNHNWEELFYDFTPYWELLMADHRQLKDLGWQLPTKEMLIGNAWEWSGYLKDGTEVFYKVTFHEGALFVRWNDGWSGENYEYPDARWELTYDEGFAVLSIDFREFGGIMEYNLLYDSNFGELYVAMNAVTNDLNLGWEPTARFLVPAEPDANPN